jgi:hypothetical protein
MGRDDNANIVAHRAQGFGQCADDVAQAAGFGERGGFGGEEEEFERRRHWVAFDESREFLSRALIRPSTLILSSA